MRNLPASSQVALSPLINAQETVIKMSQEYRGTFFDGSLRAVKDHIGQGSGMFLGMDGNAARTRFGGCLDSCSRIWRTHELSDRGESFEG